jgi:ribosome-associated toxin RatA of RatAB toxin-antitoxin module
VNPIQKSVEIPGPPDEVFQVISDLAAWPHHLPHFRWVRVVEHHPDYLVARMACYHGWLPVDWLVRFESELSEREVRFTHLAGLTRGMIEVWRVEPVNDGSTSKVIVTHNLESVFRRLGGVLGSWVIQYFYIDYRVPLSLYSFAQHFTNRPATNGAKGNGGKA